MNLPSRIRVGALFALPLLFSSNAHALQTTPPSWNEGSTIYFYNGCHPDMYNLGAEGWILSEMSMLGASGLLNSTSGTSTPAPGFGTGVTSQPVNSGDGHATSPGSVLSNPAGARIGYASSDNKEFAFDLDKVNLNDMLGLLPNAARIVIAKHGYSGGGFLDGGEDYSGYTGAPYPGWGPPPGPNDPVPPVPPATPGNPYPLPNNPGVEYEVYLNTCFSDDPGPGGSPSASGSAGAIPGVTCTGNNGLIYKGPTITHSGPSPWPSIYLLAYLNGFTTTVNVFGFDIALPDATSYLGSLSFDEFDDLIRDLASSLGTQLTVNWDKSANSGGGSGTPTQNDYLDMQTRPFHYYAAPQLIGSQGGTIKYGAGAYVRPVELEVPRGALPDGAGALFIDFRPHAELIPAGMRPMTQFVHVDFYKLNEDLQFAESALLTLHLDQASPAVLYIARIDEETGAISLMNYSLAADGTSCAVKIQEEGTYVAVTTDDGSTLAHIIDVFKMIGVF